jgi:predicted DNA-binding transcriptional regulator AlpA
VWLNAAAKSRVWRLEALLLPSGVSRASSYMTIEEVARSLRLSVPTVRWLRQEDRFAPAIKIGRRLV